MTHPRRRGPDRRRTPTRTRAAASRRSRSPPERRTSAPRAERSPRARTRAPSPRRKEMGSEKKAFLCFRLVDQQRIDPPRRAFWSGYAFGLGLFGAGVSWVYVSLHTFGAMPLPLAALATFLFCAFLALFPAAAGWLQARIP